MRLLLASLVLLMTAPLAAQSQVRVAGYETYAVVAPVADEAQALPFAARHCARYDRFADFRRMDGAAAIFDCETQRRDRKPNAANGTGIY